MNEQNRRMHLSNKYRFVDLNGEIVFMPLSDSISKEAFTFSDDVGKIIAEGIISEQSERSIVEMILKKYEATYEVVDSDVQEIISHLISKGVVKYHD